jgi:hypothetical protein
MLIAKLHLTLSNVARRRFKASIIKYTAEIVFISYSNHSRNFLVKTKNVAKSDTSI